MKEVKVTLYSFNELDEKVKENVVHNYFVNDWYDYEDCVVEDCKHNNHNDCVFETKYQSYIDIYYNDPDWINEFCEDNYYLFTKGGYLMTSRYPFRDDDKGNVIHDKEIVG